MSPELASPIPKLEDVAIRMNAPIPPGPPDLIPRLMPKKGQLVIAGETNIGKSLVAIEMISALVMGSKLWGQIEPTEKIRKVLYVLAEHYPEALQGNYARTGLKVTDDVLIMGPEQLGSDKWLVSRGQQNPQAMYKFHRWAEGVDLIVFDPLSAFCTGVDVENDNVQMRAVLDNMSLIAQKANASCLVLAHEGKPMMDQFGKEHKKTRYAIRGASAIEDAATNIFYLGRDNSGDAASSAASPGQLYELVCRKYKGESVDRFRLLRDPATNQHTLLADNAYRDVMRIDYRGKLARLQARNEAINYGTALKLLADMEGIPVDTLKRRLSELD